MVYFISVLGQRFGNLTVISEDGSEKRLCECDCGTKKKIRIDTMKSGKVKTCGLCHKGNHRFISVLGNRYGDLVVIEEHQKNRNRRVMVRCDCGNIVHRLLTNLKRGQTKTCGCKKWYNHTHGIIYYLLDPNTQEIRYIGQTTQQPLVRLNGHTCTGPARGRLRCCKEKGAWIKSLKPLKPIIFVVESGIPVSQLDIVERQYIECQKYNGCKLFNIHHNRNGVLDE